MAAVVFQILTFSQPPITVGIVLVALVMAVLWLRLPSRTVPATNRNTMRA